MTWQSVTAPVHVSGIVDHNADAVWALLRDFTALKHYAHDVVSSDIEDGRAFDQVGAVRLIVIENGRTARERLVALSDAERYLRTLLLPPEPMPLRNYSERMQVTPLSGEPRCVVELVGTFSVPEGTTEDMQARLTAMYTAALDGIRHMSGRHWCPSNRTMDPLSSVLGLLKPTSYLTAGFDAGGEWALLLDDLAGRIKCYAVVAGKCWLSVLPDGEPVALHAGECFVLPSGRDAVIASDPKVVPRRASEVLDPNRSGEVVVLNGGGDVFLTGSRFEVNGRHAERLLGTLPPMILVDAADDRSRLRWCIHAMMAELRERRPGSTLVAQQLSQMILVQALRLHLEQQESRDVGWFAAAADPQIGSALSAIHGDPAKAWTVEALARTAGLSRAAFSQRFGEKVGEAPIAYLTRWRMMLAGDRLVEGRDPVARIGASLGYASEPAFSNAFSRIMGISPRRYAKEAWLASSNCERRRAKA